MRFRVTFVTEVGVKYRIEVEHSTSVGAIHAALDTYVVQAALSDKTPSVIRRIHARVLTNVPKLAVL